MLRFLLAVSSTVLACSNGGAPIIVYDAAVPACASCNIFDNKCPNDLKCEFGTGTGTLVCGPDKVGTGGIGTACKTPADCANGYDCLGNGATNTTTCTQLCLQDSDCPNGMTCGRVPAGCEADFNAGWCE